MHEAAHYYKASLRFINANLRKKALVLTWYIIEVNTSSHVVSPLRQVDTKGEYVA